MKYMGNKQRIADDIVPIMLNNYNVNTFVDAFCGSCSVIEKVPQYYKRIANDKQKYLIAMWKTLTNGGNKELPMHIDRDLYNSVRDCSHGRNSLYQDDYVGWVGFMASFNGRFFDGGYSGHHVKGSNGKERDYISENIRNTLAQVDALRNVEFHSGEYYDITIPPNSLIYCDIPYKDTKQYATSKNFDYDRFYQWCKEMKACGHSVFISEYQMPSDFTCIWQRQVTNAMNLTKTKSTIEKLFTI